MDHLQSFNQSPSAIQNFIVDCPSVTDNSDSYNDSSDSSVACVKSRSKLLQAHPKEGYLKICGYTSVYSKPLYVI